MVPCREIRKRVGIKASKGSNLGFSNWINHRTIYGEGKGLRATVMSRS